MTLTHGISPLAYSPDPQRFTSAKELYLYDEHGESYLDACSGTFNIALGYGHPTVVDALKGVLDSGLLHLSSSYSHEQVYAASEALVSIAPDNITSCHMKGATGGSSAIEQAIRHCWATTGKRTIVSFRKGHHGQTIASTAVSGMPFRRNRIPVPSVPVVYVEPPDCYRCPYGLKPSNCGLACLKPIEEALDHAPSGENDVAAFIAEPILGAGGGLSPPMPYWGELHARLQKRNIPLVFDEVQTFGRTGHFFAADYYQVKPELIAVAKGISGIGVPGAGALLMEERFRVLESHERSLTWGATVLSSTAIRATIEVMRQPGFFEAAEDSANVLADRLARMHRRFDCVGTIRGMGLMTGLEIVTSKVSKDPAPELAHRIIDEAMENRLILRGSEYGRGCFIKLRPPLVITPEQVHDMCDRLERAIETVTTGQGVSRADGSNSALHS